MKHLVDGGEWQRPDGMPEMSQDRGLGERTLRSQESHLQGLLLREAGGHDLAEQPQDLLIAKRSGVALAGHAQHLRFTLGAVEVDRTALTRLRDADQLRETRPIVDEAVDLFVDGVDLPADFLEIQSGRRPARGLRRRRPGEAWFFLFGHRTARGVRRSAP